MNKREDLVEKISCIAFMLKHIYSELIEMSEEIEYIHQQEPNCYAGDDLKDLASCLMDEIQKIYPVDY